MGVDLGAIMEHKLTPKQIIEMPSIIDTWTEIRQLKKAHEDASYNYGERFEKQLKSNCKWMDGIVPTEETLEIIWSFYESTRQGGCAVSSFRNCLDTFFGDIRFFRKVAIVTHSPEHKFANLRYPDIAQNMLEVNRAIAEKFNANKIVYATDCGFVTEEVYHQASNGLSLDEHIENMNKQFFVPPKDLREAISLSYFIDDFSTDISNLREWQVYESS
jgi:hypothetical protein